MSFAPYLGRLQGKSFSEKRQILIGAIMRRTKRLVLRIKDKHFSSFSKRSHISDGDWHWRLAEGDFDQVVNLPETIRLCSQYLEHLFDILGTGLISVKLRGSCAPFEKEMPFDQEGFWLRDYISKQNFHQSRQIWKMIFEGPWAADSYEPIDWQRDFKSGMSWDCRTWFMDIAIGSVSGADIKVPWELARLQHLPLMAVMASRREGISGQNLLDTRQYVIAIRSQILNFIACNPPRFGIHWRTPMELAVRGANILLALDILRKSGVVLDDEVLSVIHDFLDAQTRHILSNLEWSEQERGNHYYANVLGVLFAACYLPSTPERQVWKAFAVHQLNLETDRQFLQDGGSFEGSTGYHRLTLEMAIYGFALVQGFGREEHSQFDSYNRALLKVRPPFPSAPLPRFEARSGKSLFSRNARNKVFRAVQFMADVTRPDQRFTQIGDVDSGRLFKLQPISRNGREDTISPSGVIGAAAGIFPEFIGSTRTLDQKVVQSLARGRKMEPGKSQSLLQTNFAHFSKMDRFLKGFEDSSPAFKRKLFFPGEVPTERLKFCKYPYFGLYIFKGKGFHLSFRCFDHEIGGAWGHAHDDNLSLELVLDGQSIVTDPGSFVYTGNPELRKLYRGPFSHHAPRVLGRQAADTSSALFSIRHLAKGECLYFGKRAVLGRLKGEGWATERMIVLRPEGVEIWDRSEEIELAPYRVEQAEQTITDGYGRETKNPICSF